MTTASVEQTDQKIPAAAARFAASGMFQFAEGEEGADGVPVRLHARDAKPIYHWYWGKIAHDMSGVVHRDKLAIDWCHDPDQLIGFVDEIKADGKRGLDLAGQVLSGIDEKAAEVAKKAAAGVPYESSIDWTGPAVIEYVDASTSVDVNGYKFEGPGYVVRQWHLRGVAICPHGADLSTTTEFSAGQEVGVTVFTQTGKGVVMPTTTAQSQPTKDNAQPAAGATDQATKDSQGQAGGTPKQEAGSPAAGTQDSAGKADPQPPKPAAAAADSDRAEAGKRFMNAFGDTLGAKLFAQGLSFEDATAEHAKLLTAENASLKDELSQLKQQVGVLRGQMGEAEPATFTPEGSKPADPPQSQQGAGENAKRFAAAIKLPKAKTE